MAVEIPRGVLDGETARINALTKRGQQAVKTQLKRLAQAYYNDDGVIDAADVARLRQAATELVTEVAQVLTDDAASVAASTYDEIRAGSRVSTPFLATSDNAFDPDALDGASRAMAESIVESGSADTYISEMSTRLGYEIARAAGECTMRNGRRDPAKPKFARVPSGAETCPFCVMLASRGFVYSRGGAMSHYHDGCDCRIVPGFKLTRIRGYDVAELYKQYAGMMSDGTLNNGALRASADRANARAKLTMAVTDNAGLMKRYLRESKSLEDLQSRMADISKSLGGLDKAASARYRAEFGDVAAEVADSLGNGS